jgi:hypothetical protein
MLLPTLSLSPTLPLLSTLDTDLLDTDLLDTALSDTVLPTWDKQQLPQPMFKK